MRRRNIMLNNTEKWRSKNKLGNSIALKDLSQSEDNDIFEDSGMNSLIDDDFDVDFKDQTDEYWSSSVTFKAFLMIFGMILFVSLWIYTENSLELVFHSDKTLESFSEDNARGYLSVMSQEQHCLGSERQDVFLYNWLISTSEEIAEKAIPGIEIEVLPVLVERGRPITHTYRANFPCINDGETIRFSKNASFFAGSNIRNVMVRVSSKNNPESKENAFLLNSHVDARIMSFGGGDDGSATAVNLELLRIMSRNEEFVDMKHSVIFLFNNGEELGLLGASVFQQNNPWASSIKAFANMEGAGAGGRELLFQASIPYFANLYTKIAPRPYVSVVAQDIFQNGLIPSATDFELLDQDYVGLDLAYIDRAYVYHTPLDKMDLVDQGSLAHFGHNIYNIVKYLTIEDPESLKILGDARREDVIPSVFYDLPFGLSVVYGGNFSFFLYNITILLVLINEFRIKKGNFSRYLISCAVSASRIIFVWMVVLTAAVVHGILFSYVSSMFWYSAPGIALLTFIPASLFSVLISLYVWDYYIARFVMKGYSKFDLYQNKEEQNLFGSILLLSLFVFIPSISRKVGSIYLVWFWLMSTYIYMVFDRIRIKRNLSIPKSLLHLIFVVPLFLSIEILFTLYHFLTATLGRDGPLPVDIVVCFYSAMMTMVCIGVTTLPFMFKISPKDINRILIIVGVISIATTTGAIILGTPYTELVPKRTQWTHMYDLDADKSHIDVTGHDAISPERVLTPEMPFEFSLISKALMRSEQVDPPNLTLPTITIINSEDIGENKRNVTIEMQHPGTSHSRVLVGSASPIREISFDGIVSPIYSNDPRGILISLRGGKDSSILSSDHIFSFVIEGKETVKITLSADYFQMDGDINRTGSSTLPIMMKYLPKFALNGIEEIKTSIVVSQDI